VRKHHGHVGSWQRDGDARCCVTGEDRRYDAGGSRGEDATRQVLKHLTLETVVIDRMGRTTWDRRRIDVPVRLRPMRVDVAGRVRLRWLRKPRQRAERWPSQRNERDPGDNPFDPPHIWSS